MSTFPCPWLVKKWGEDGDRIVECGAPAQEVDHGNDLIGWACSHGHEHVPIEISLAPYGPEWQREQADH